MKVKCPKCKETYETKPHELRNDEWCAECAPEAPDERKKHYQKKNNNGLISAIMKKKKPPNINKKQLVCKRIFQVLVVWTLLNYVVQVIMGARTDYDGVFWDCIGEIFFWWFIVIFVFMKNVFKSKISDSDNAKD